MSNFEYTGGVDTMITAYIEAALWSSTDSEDHPLDDSFDEEEDCTPELLAQAREDCAAFVESNRADLDDMNAQQAGHDFWLTRNGHGAGFWDRGLGEVGRRLTDCAHAFDLYVTDDGKVASN